MPGGSGQQLRKEFFRVFAQQIQQVEFFLDASRARVILDRGYLYQHYPWSVESEDVINYWLGSEDFKKAQRPSCGLENNEVLCKSVPKLFGKKSGIKHTTIDVFRNQRLQELFNNFLDEANSAASESFYDINLPKDNLTLTRITIILFFYNFLPIFKNQPEKFKKLVAIAQGLLPKKHSADDKFYQCLVQVALISSVDSTELHRSVSNCLDAMSAYMTSHGAQPAEGAEGSRNHGNLSDIRQSVVSTRVSDLLKATTGSRSSHGPGLTPHESIRGELGLLGFLPFSQQTSVVAIQHSGHPGNFLEEVMHDYISSRLKTNSSDTTFVDEVSIDETRRRKLDEAVYIKNLMRDMQAKVSDVSHIVFVRDYVNSLAQDSSFSSYSAIGFKQYCALIVAHLNEWLLHLCSVNSPEEGDYMHHYFAMRKGIGLGEYFYQPYPRAVVAVKEGEELSVSRVKAVAQDFLQKYDAQLTLIQDKTLKNYPVVLEIIDIVKTALKTPRSNLDQQINPASILVLKDILDHVITQFYLIAYQQAVPQLLSKKATAALQEPKYAVPNILFPGESTPVEGLQKLQVFITRLAFLEKFKASQVDGKKSVVVLPDTLIDLAKKLEVSLQSGVNEVLEIKFQVFNLKNELEKLLHSYQAVQKAGYQAGYTRANARKKTTDQLIVLSNIVALFSVSSNLYPIINDIINTQNKALCHIAFDRQLNLFSDLRKLLSGTLAFVNMQLKPQLESAGKLAEFSQDEDSLSHHILTAQGRSVAIIKLLETIESLYISLNQKVVPEFASSASSGADSQAVETVIQRLAEYKQELLDPGKAKLSPLVSQPYVPPGGLQGVMLKRRSLLSPTKSKNPRRSHAAVYSKSGSPEDLASYSDCESDTGRESVHSVGSVMSAMTLQSTTTTACMIDSEKQTVAPDIQKKRNNLKRFFGPTLMQQPPYDPVRTENRVVVKQLPYFEEVMQDYLISRCIGKDGECLEKFDKVRVSTAVDIINILTALTEGVVIDRDDENKKLNIDRRFIETISDYLSAVSGFQALCKDSTGFLQKGDLQRSCILLAAYLKTMSLRLDGISIPELMHNRLPTEQVKYDYLLFYSNLRSRSGLPESSFLLSPAALPRNGYQEAVLSKLRMQSSSRANKVEVPTLQQIMESYQKQRVLIDTHLEQDDKTLIAELFQLAEQVFAIDFEKKTEVLFRLVGYIDSCVSVCYRKAYFVAAEKCRQDQAGKEGFDALEKPVSFMMFPSSDNLNLLDLDINSVQHNVSFESMVLDPLGVCKAMVVVNDLLSHIVKYTNQIDIIIRFQKENESIKILEESDIKKIYDWVGLTANVLDTDQTAENLLCLSDFFECCMRYFYQKAYRVARIKLPEEAFFQLEPPLPFHGVPADGDLLAVGRMYQECQPQFNISQSVESLSPLAFCQEIEAEHLKQVVQDPFLKHSDDLDFIQIHAPRGYAILSSVRDTIKNAMKDIKQRLTPSSMLLLLDIMDVCVQYYYRVAYEVAKFKLDQYGQSCVAGKPVPIGFYRDTQSKALQKLQGFMFELSNYPFLRQSTLDEGQKTPELFRTTLQQLAVIIGYPISAPLVDQNQVADTSDHPVEDSPSMSVQEYSLRYDIKSDLQRLYGLLTTLVGADGYGAVISVTKKMAYTDNELSCFQEAMDALSLHLFPCVSRYNSAEAKLPSSMLMLENLQKRFEVSQDLLVVMEHSISQQIHFNLQLAGRLTPEVSRVINATQEYAQQAVKTLGHVSGLIQALRFLLYHPNAKAGVTTESVQQDTADLGTAVVAFNSAISRLISPQSKLSALKIEKENVLQVVTAFSTPSTGSSSGGKSSTVKSSSAQKSHLNSPMATFSVLGESPSSRSTPRLHTPGQPPLTPSKYKTPDGKAATVRK